MESIGNSLVLKLLPIYSKNINSTLLLTKFCSKDLTAIEIENKRKQELVLASVYMLSDEELPQRELTEFIQFGKTSSWEIVICIAMHVTPYGEVKTPTRKLLRNLPRAAMFYLAAYAICSLLVPAYGNHIFPSGFKFGAATSSYQIEGAWNISGRGEGEWDRVIHSDPATVADGSNADIACDSYHQWREDVKMAEYLGLHYYRFAISWPRILPTGLPNYVNKEGVEYYNKLINALIEKGIEPVVTMYHSDLPQKIVDLGGWLNPYTADLFRDYAAVLFSLYADRVKTWITINEPVFLCDVTYSMGIFPPRIIEPEVAPFLCNKNVLIAHAKAWRLYEEGYRSKYHGKLAISNNQVWIDPATDKDVELAELGRQFGIGRYAHPIYSKEGGWPPSIVRHMAEYSERNRFPRSILPSFTEEEIKLIKGTFDFYSLNYYTARKIRHSHEGEEPGVWFVNGSRHLDAILFSDPKWQTTTFFDFPIVPEGLRYQIAWVHKQYGGVPILISENGYADDKYDIYDEGRVHFIHEHLKQLLLSIHKDGANVIGYTFWSLMDNFEWAVGYQYKFGLYQVDFSDPKRTRRPRVSAHYYKHIINNNTLEIPPEVHQMLRNVPTQNGGQFINRNDILMLTLCIFWLIT